MTRIKIYTIGRNSGNDYVIKDDTVSRSHAEYVICDDGRLYLTDRHSTSGSFVYRNDEWHKLRQEFIEPHEKLRFGDAEVTPADLASRKVTVARAVAEDGTKDRKVEEADPGTGFIRNPETGEIVSKQ